MKILLNDIIQYSDAPPDLKNPSLENMYHYTAPLVITFDRERRVNCLGIGNTDATELELTFDGSTVVSVPVSENGLYVFPDSISVTASSVQAAINGFFMGRLAMGTAFTFGIAVAREPGFNSTQAPRTTLSGQVVEGSGGYAYRSISVDLRYKIGLDAMAELQEAFPAQIARGIPFFLSFEEERDRIPFMPRLYAKEKDQLSMSFESGINKPLFSKRWTFEECF
jgi:hypothetical protein